MSAERTTGPGPADRLDEHGRPRIVEAGRPDSTAFAEAPGRRLWFAILAPHVAWTASELAGYAIADRSCAAGDGSLTTAGIIGLVVLNLGALALTAAAGVVAWGVFRRWSSESFVQAEGWSRVQFMAMAGVLISGLLFLNMVYFGVMPLILNPCLEIP